MLRFQLLRNFGFIFLIFLTQPLLAQDQLGVFFDAQGTQSTTTTSTAYSQVSAWVQLIDPTASEALTAFEFRLEVHSDGPDPILVWTLPDQALNIAEAPAFMVGLGTPIALEPRTTLAEVMIIVPEAGQTVWLTLHPLENPSLKDPPEYGYPVCQPVYAVGSDSEMRTMTVSTGCESAPVASINPAGNPPTIKVSGLPPSLTLQKDSQGKQIEFLSLRNNGEVSYSGLAYVTGTTPIQFAIDGHYNTGGPVSFQVPVGGSTRITPYYEGGGSVDATIELDICGERWSVPVGSTDSGLECAWSVSSLDFGEVNIGESAVLHAEVTNAGYEPLPLESEISVPNFTLQKISHPGSFLAIGESCNYRITFEPYETGAISETVNIGSQICSLELTGYCLDGPPACQLSYSTLDFPDFMIGANPVGKTFTIRNVGGGTLEGNATLNDSSGAFELSASSAGSFALTNNESKTITVNFGPLEEGLYSAEVELGLGCGPVTLEGEAIIVPPECSINYQTLDYHDVIIGSTRQYKSFRISNTGGGVLEGTISLNDATGAFQLVNGGGPFYISASSSKTVGVYFDPEIEGMNAAEISLGLECAPVSLVGNAVDLEPECLTSVTFLDFGEFVVGQYQQNKYFRITNTGGGLMQGHYTLSDTTGAFSLYDYENTLYSLAHNQSQYVYVNFSALEAGQYFEQLDLGGVCGSIALTANAIELAPQCQVDVTELVFDEQIVGGYSQNKYFRVKNIGGGLLEGTATLSDTTSGFEIENWNGGSYSLPHMATQSFRVSFNPPAAGNFSTVADLGADCGSIPFSGSGIELDPLCQLVGYGLDNDVFTIRPIPVGGSITGSIGVRNIGGGLLTGEMTLDDNGGPFQIVGSNQYSLANGRTFYLRVKFTPQNVGSASTILHTGALCGDITISSIGEESYADCRSYFYHNSFDRISVGETAVAYIYIYNTGYMDMEGDLQVDGEGFQLANPGPFTLGVGERRYEELYFIPETVGDFSAVVTTGLSLCPGEWDVEGHSVPAGSDQMGFYFDSEGTENTLFTNGPKVRETAYLVLHNPSAEGQLVQWYVNFWSSGSAMMMDDWSSHLAGNFDETSYRKRLYLESPVPYSETMVLADFSILVPDPNQASRVNIGYAYYQTMTDTGLDYYFVREPVDLVINANKSELKKLPATPVAYRDEETVVLEWPCAPRDFEGFHVYRRVDDEQPERLTSEPLAFTEFEGRYEDTNLPEDSFALHYYVTSLFKGVESEPGLEVTLEMVEPENEIPAPTQTRLLAIYPNPFNPETNISFDIAQPTRVQIKIYDVGGRLVRNLTDQHFEAGHFEETWNGRDDAGRTLPSNVYYARMVADSVVQMRKMTLLK